MASTVPASFWFVVSSPLAVRKAACPPTVILPDASTWKLVLLPAVTSYVPVTVPFAGLILDVMSARLAPVSTVFVNANESLVLSYVYVVPSTATVLPDSSLPRTLSASALANVVVTL
ncbi:hypothetical protein D3C72_2011060 [compost metagenome]